MSIRIDGTNTTANPGITGADTDTGLQFGTNEIELVTGGTNRATVESNGNLTIEDGNLVVASGHGIDFSATTDSSGTSSSELLDDYEEGTWTPQYAGATTSGTYTYSVQEGAYTKIGNRVTVDFNLSNISTSAAGEGAIRIKGLPFTAQSAQSVHPHGTCRLSQHDIAGTTVNITVTPIGGDNRLSVIISRDNTSATSVTVANKASNNADILGSCTYFVE